MEVCGLEIFAFSYELLEKAIIAASRNFPPFMKPQIS
jgi:hypothetical protein